MSDFLFATDKNMSQDSLLDAWIAFLASLKGKDADQIRAMLGEPDMYLGVSNTAYQGVITDPVADHPSGTNSIVLENGLVSQISLVSRSGVTHA